MVTGVARGRSSAARLPVRASLGTCVRWRPGLSARARGGCVVDVVFRELGRAEARRLAHNHALGSTPRPTSNIRKAPENRSLRAAGLCASATRREVPPFVSQGCHRQERRHSRRRQRLVIQERRHFRNTNGWRSKSVDAPDNANGWRSKSVNALDDANGWRSKSVDALDDANGW